MCSCVDSTAPLRPALRTSNPPSPPTSAVLAHKNRQALESFHRFSVAVWTIWLVPCFCGMLTGIPMINLSANAAFGVALIGADVISLALYLRGMHGGQHIDTINSFKPCLAITQSA